MRPQKPHPFHRPPGFLDDKPRLDNDVAAVADPARRRCMTSAKAATGTATAKHPNRAVSRPSTKSTGTSTAWARPRATPPSVSTAPRASPPSWRCRTMRWNKRRPRKRRDREGSPADHPLGWWQTVWFVAGIMYDGVVLLRRVIEERYRDTVAARRVTIVTGPRQSGKTTLSPVARTTSPGVPSHPRSAAARKTRPRAKTPPSAAVAAGKPPAL
jgi:hypothetical protein